MQSQSYSALQRLALRLSSRCHGGAVQSGCRAFADDALAAGEIGAVSGAPDEVLSRKVIIYSPARTPSQQGMSKSIGKQAKGPTWKLEFSTQQKWEIPLIGWTSTADPLEHVARATLAFDTQEDAARFCQKQGWSYEVREPHFRRTTRQKRFLGYGDNFSIKRNGLPDGGLISEGTAAEYKKKDTAL